MRTQSFAVRPNYISSNIFRFDMVRALFHQCIVLSSLASLLDNDLILLRKEQFNLFLEHERSV